MALQVCWCIIFLPSEYIQNINSPLFKGRWDFWEIIDGRDKDFFVKMGVLSIEGARHYFSLVMQAFCSNSEKHEEVTFPHDFVLVFILCFIGAILSKKCWEKVVFQKNKIKRQDFSIEGGSTNLPYTIMHCVTTVHKRY